MKRQVGQTRRNRANGPAPSGAARPGLAKGGTEEDQTAPYPIAPHDLNTERLLAASLASWNHLGTKPDPADFYDVTLGRIARAFIDHADRIRGAGTALLDHADGPVWAYTYAGLEEVLTELGDTRPALTAAYAGVLGATSATTDGVLVARLAELAHARRRLVELETERAELERLTQDPRHR